MIDITGQCKSNNGYTVKYGSRLARVVELIGQKISQMGGCGFEISRMLSRSSSSHEPYLVQLISSMLFASYCIEAEFIQSTSEGKRQRIPQFKINCMGPTQFSILVTGVGGISFRKLICFKRESYSLEIKWIVLISPTRNSTLYLKVGCNLKLSLAKFHSHCVGAAKSLYQQMN